MNTSHPKLVKCAFLCAFVWLIIFGVMPNIATFIISFLNSCETRLVKLPLTLANYRALCDPLYLKTFTYSLYLAAYATLLCLCIGYPLALCIAQLASVHRKLAVVLLIIPFWTNSLLRTYGLKLFLGSYGILNLCLTKLKLVRAPIQFMYSETAVLIGLVYVLLPFMVLPIFSALEKIDKTYLEAARDLGAGKYKRALTIVLPLTMTGIVGGCLLVFLPAVGMFYVADLMGGPKQQLIGNLLKSQFLILRNWPFGAAISVSLMGCLALMLYVYSLISYRKPNSTPSGCTHA